MNILIASVFSYNSYSRGIMPDVLQTTIDRYPDANIFYLTNSGSFKVCYFNIDKRPELCYQCKLGVNQALKRVSGHFTHIKIKSILSKQEVELAEKFFQDEEAISLDIKYENFEVGEATLSTYISRTRDRELINVRQNFVKELAINALALYLGTKRFLHEKNIDLVYNFNGRQDYVRAIFRAARSLNIDCFNIERARTGGYIESFKNTLTHNIQAKRKFVDASWENSQESPENKNNIGADFFSRQRSGADVIFPSHLKNQKRNLIPIEILNGKENVILFTSSDDEYAALGEDFQNPIYFDQFEGINYLANLFGERIKDQNLVIRMHPNLKDVTYDYALNIKKLDQKFSNVFVIYPESEVDSYALLKTGSKIVTFGSTLGLEATFYGIPSILLGKCYYYYDDVSYTPLKKEEIEFLLKSKLMPKPKENALKFGYYFLKAGQKRKYYYEKEILGEVFFKDKKIPDLKLSHKIILKIIKIFYNITGIRLNSLF